MNRVEFPDITYTRRIEEIEQALSCTIVPQKQVRQLLRELTILVQKAPGLRDRVVQLAHQCVDHLINRKVETIVDQFRDGKNVQRAIRALEHRYSLDAENRALLSIAKGRPGLDEVICENLLEIATCLVLERTGQANLHISNLPPEVLSTIDWENPFESILKALLGRGVSQREVRAFVQELISFAAPLPSYTPIR